MSHRAVGIEFRAIAEDLPGPALQREFRRLWPAYERWFGSEGDAARPSYATALRMLRRHLPELEPTYERLVELAGGGDRAARFLALYNPPPFFSGCSQACWTRDGEVALVRNYDYPVRRCEGLLLESSWRATRVIAMADCLWGVLDGMNEHGLAVSLAFGGRKAVGEGFGITLVLRYLLETCRNTRDAAQTLARVPVHRAYNIALLDADGDFATVRVAPDRPARVDRFAVSANSQEPIDWPEHIRHSQTTLREQYLESAIAADGETLDGFVERFLYPPLYRRPGVHDWGTLYTACYLPRRGTVELRWPQQRWQQSFDAFREGAHPVSYGAGHHHTAA